jgi:general secretion pathway protein B
MKHNDKQPAMSLILDALNRSNDDTDDVPTLGTRHAYVAETPAKNFWLLAVVLALVAAVAVIAWLLWDRGQNADTPAVVQQAAPQLEKAQAKVVATSKAESEQRLAPGADELATVKQQSPIAASEATPAKRGVAAITAVSALYASERPVQDGNSQVTQSSAVVKITKPEAPVLEKTANGSGTSAVVEEGVDIERLLKSAENELENARLEEHSAPFVNGLSQQTKDRIPSIFYERHDYSGRPGQSRVVLNGKDLKVGGSPASGLKVEEILPDSTVLNYRGTRFRLRALNSWVNL